MKKIKIEINQAKILSYEIDMDEKYPEVSATIGLYAGEKLISKFTLSTKSWQEVKFDLPIKLIEPIKELANNLETILILKCSQSMGELKVGKK